MTPFADMDASFLIKDRTAGAHGKSQCSSCKNEIQICHCTIIIPYHLYISRGLCAQIREDGLDFLLFLCVELFQVVVQFHYSHRLDK